MTRIALAFCALGFVALAGCAGIEMKPQAGVGGDLPTFKPVVPEGVAWKKYR